MLVFLVQLLLLVGLARLLGGLMKSLGQPSVVGELVAGVILGPSVFGALFPEQHAWVWTDEPVVTSAVFGLAWLGVIMLLVAIGFETDLAIIRRFGKAAVFVAAGSLLIPLATGASAGLMAPESFRAEGAQPAVFAGFFALALAVSALPVVAKILLDLGFLRRNFGQITLAAGMTMDSVGWLILAALAGIARESRLDLASLAQSLGGLIVFLLLAATVGRWILDQVYRRILGSGASVTAAMTIMMLAALAGAAVTQALELESILGAFIVGILLGTTRHHLPEARHTLENMTAAFFSPIFFAFSGLRVDLTALASAEAILWTLGIIVLAIVAKVFGTYIGARLGGINSDEGLVLGAGLSALGAMGIVVALVGLNVGVLSESGYTVLVLAAIVTSLVSPILLRWTVRGMATPDDEQKRLDKESLRERSILLNANRLLLPTRGGRNSAYAAEIIASVFGDAEVDILLVDVVKGSRLRHWFGRATRGSSSGPEDVIEALGSTNHRILRRVARDPAAVIIEEGQLGHDLIVLGASDPDGDSSVFSSVVDQVLAGSGRPSIVVKFPVGHDAPDSLPSRVLVPVTARASTRAAEELAYSVAVASGGSVLALHVVNQPTEQPGIPPDGKLIEEGQRAAVELLAEAMSLGSRLGASVETLVKVSESAEHSILDLANGGEFELLVLGTARRPLTNRPFFGHRVSYILEHAQIPVVVVSLPE